MASEKFQDAEVAHVRQSDYLKGLQGGDIAGPIVVPAFLRGSRDLGYRTTAHALDELVDNALEAGADTVLILFGYDEGSRKPRRLAVMDNGVGMVPDMVRAAVAWGGSDREGSRTGFGRYGFGLPSAPLSQGTRVNVYSRVSPDKRFTHAGLDITSVAETGRLAEKSIEPIPSWISRRLEPFETPGTKGISTVLVVENLDRLSWKTTKGLRDNLVEHFGITYRNVLGGRRLIVHGQRVVPIDPLFTTPGALHYDYDDDRAQEVDTIRFLIATTHGQSAEVAVRLSYMPPTFQRSDKTLPASRGNQNPRFPIMREHNGLILVRNGRQISVTSRGAPTSFTNYDRNIGIEISFPGELDSEFGVTTSKQHVTLSDSVWKALESAHVWKVIKNLRRRFREDLQDLESTWDSMATDAPSRSSFAMNQTVRIIGQRKAPSTAASQRSLPDGFRINVRSMPGAPFYLPELSDGYVMAVINSDHRFFSEIYSPLRDPTRVREKAALESLLLVLADCEIGAVDTRSIFYEAERYEWSRRLNAVLGTLETTHEVDH